MIATTIEQSKRLLEAGIDPQTADMFWDRGTISSLPGFEWMQEQPHPILSKNKKDVIEQPEHFPLAWSLSALITLCPEHVPYRIIRTRGMDIEGIFEDLVEFLCNHAKIEKIWEE